MYNDDERLPMGNAGLSVLILARTKDAGLEACVQSWESMLGGLGREYEILLVEHDAASVAQAWPERLGQMSHVRVLGDVKPQGPGEAIREALAQARHPLFFYTNSSPIYRPADFPEFLKRIDKVDVVAGYRAGRAVPAMWQTLGSLYRTFFWLMFGPPKPPPLPGWLGWRGHFYSKVMEIVTGLDIRDTNCAFRLFRKEIFARIPIQSQDGFVHGEILAKANFLNCTGDEVELKDVEAEIEPLVPILSECREVLADTDFGPAKLPETSHA